MPFIDNHTEIVKQLQTHATYGGKKVIKYGDTLPAAPYVVVKEEYDFNTKRQVFRVIPHFVKGQHEFMKFYTRKDVYDLLRGFKIKDSLGATVMVVECQNRDLGELPIQSDDATISREAVYYVPDSMQIQT